MIRSKFFWQNFLSFVLIIAFTTFIVSYLLVSQAKQFIESNTNASIQEKLPLFLPLFQENETWRDAEQIKKIINLAHQAKVRLTVLNEAGEFLIESEAEEVQVAEGQSDRPELKEARHNTRGTAKRFSDNSDSPALYTAQKIETSSGPLIIRLGVPMKSIKERLQEIFFVLAIGAGFGMILSLLMALIFVRRITIPVSEMTRVTTAISLGNYQARIKRLPNNELGLLGKAINRLVDAVEANITRREKIEKIRREFSSNISHELKTPLTSIKGYVDTLISGAIHDQSNNVRFLTIISNNVDRLSSLVKESLDLATIEANEGLIALEAVDWKPIVQESLARQHFRILNKRMQVDIQFLGRGSTAKGDRKAMSHILDNLLQNAIHYTPSDGRIKIAIEEKDGYTELAVTDNGIGISPSDQARIFERFFRVDDARTRNDAGTGLGLAIVKHLVIQIQGTITVKSDIAKGSTFTLRLPSMS